MLRLSEWYPLDGYLFVNTLTQCNIQMTLEGNSCWLYINLPTWCTDYYLFV